MGDTDDAIHTLSPHEAFAAVGHEIRVEILQALWENRPEPISFVELFDRIHIDDSGQFNYHLSQLVGHFVTHDDEGYRLRNAGREVVLAILADVETENLLADPVSVGTACYHCEMPVVAWYDDGWLHVECTTCGRTYAGCPFPAAGLQQRSVEEILAVFAVYHRHVFRLTTREICPSCAARISTTAQFRTEDEPGTNPVIKHECTHCGLGMFSTPGVAIIDNPVVVRFHDDHDVDLTAVPLWEVTWCYDEHFVDIKSRDPLETRVRIPIGADQLEVTLDDSFAITDVVETVK